MLDIELYSQYPRILSMMELYRDISCLGGVCAKNTSRETNNSPSRMAREI